jgi:hypothetical protein
MQFKQDFAVPHLPIKMRQRDKFLLIGSCFTENMGKKLSDRKMVNLQNPHGILFNPVSIAACIRDLIRQQEYTQEHLFFLHDAWHSWLHHSRFSGNTPDEALEKMNSAIKEAHQFAKEANWAILTLGSAFAYRNLELDMHVSNNHRAPAQWFQKELLEIDFIKSLLQTQIEALKNFNPNINILLTISPVRHLRDGLIENNRSKARLIEAVHQVCAEVDYCHYFPSYEIVIDELRDYRFYDIDFAHPNYLATEYVWEQFKASCVAEDDYTLLDELYKINIALQHRSRNPSGAPHRSFLELHLEKCKQLLLQYPSLDLDKELKYFSGA